MNHAPITRRLIALVVASTALASACGSKTNAPGASHLVGSVTTDQISPDRCAENRKAGKITYLSSFDFAASASIVEVVVAKDKGYFDKLCLDVELKSSFSTANYPLVAANTAQFSSAGSYVELLGFQKDGARFVAVTDDGKTGIDALLVRGDGPVKTLADLRGKTIGVKGALPPGEVAMLNQAGLKKGDYKEVLLDGFDPKVHWKQPIDALPVFKSNEPGQLEAAGLAYQMFDPAQHGIPGSFGIIYTNKGFHDSHPTAVQDFVRASMRAMQDAIANPDDAVAICFKKITDGGNKNFLSDAGEKYRWRVEAKLVADRTPKGEGVGLLHAFDLQQQVDAYTAAGVFTTKPSIDTTFDADLVRGVYGPDSRVIFPG